MLELSRKNSNIRLHFSLQSGGKAQCDICKVSLSYHGGTTSNLAKHLKASCRQNFAKKCMTEKKSVIEVSLHFETSAIHSEGASTSSSVSNTETVTMDKVPNNKIDQPIKKINKLLCIFQMASIIGTTSSQGA